jgi:hypothetical protein
MQAPYIHVDYYSGLLPIFMWIITALHSYATHR